MLFDEAVSEDGPMGRLAPLGAESRGAPPPDLALAGAGEAAGPIDEPEPCPDERDGPGAEASPRPEADEAFDVDPPAELPPEPR